MPKKTAYTGKELVTFLKNAGCQQSLITKFLAELNESEAKIESHEQLHRSRIIDSTRMRVITDLVKRHGLLLDVGCGDGHYLSQLSNDHLMVGVDIAPTRVARSKSRIGSGRCLVMSDAAFLPFRHLVFDNVICTELLEHVYEPSSVLSEISRVLTLTGSAVISVPSVSLGKYLSIRLRKSSNYVDPMTHLREYARLGLPGFEPVQQLKNILANCGLVIKRSKGVGLLFDYAHYLPLSRHRMMAKFLMGIEDLIMKLAPVSAFCCSLILECEKKGGSN